MSGPRPGPRLRSSLGTGRLRYDLCPREAEMSRRTPRRGGGTWTGAGGDGLGGGAPLRRSPARAGGLPVCELSSGGAPVRPAIPLRGWVDVLALEPHRSAVMADFARWLARDARPWDLLHYLRLPAGSPMTAGFAGARAWAHVSLTGVVDSVEYVLPLPSDTTGWHGALGSKAQHNLRTAVRGFGRRPGGTVALT